VQAVGAKVRGGDAQFAFPPAILRPDGIKIAVMDVQAAGPGVLGSELRPAKGGGHRRERTAQRLQPDPKKQKTNDMNDDWVILGGATTPPWDNQADTETAGGRQAVARRGAGSRPSPSRTRERLAQQLVAQPPEDLGREEVEAHFRGMPARYWKTVNQEDLLWHLSTLHGFFRKLATSDSPVSPVSVGWKRFPEGDVTRVIVCSWDRRGLLQNIAAAFSALRIEIQRADVYTRSDSLVLDVFEVSEPETQGVGKEDRLNGLPFLVEGAFSDPPRFASVWATEFHKVLPRTEKPAFDLRFDNSKSTEHTVLRVAAPDRLGLLYDIVHTLTEHDLEIAQAVIETRQGIARDQFQFTDGEGLKVTSASRLRQLRKDLVAVLGS